MRAGRLLSILMLLQLRIRVTAEELADELEVSVRTIYRDIEELSASGVPVYGDRGPGGGFQLLDGYRTTLTGLASREAEAVFMIGLPTAADAMGLGDAAEQAGRKLLAALPASLREGAGRLGARFHLDPAPWYRQAETPAHLPLLARAVLDEHVVSMTYESWTGVRRWRLDPLGLVLKASSWYLVGRSGDEVRTFKVSSIHEVGTENVGFTRPDGFDLARYWVEAGRAFELLLRPATAVLQVSPIGRRRLARLGTYAASAVDAADPPRPDGWARVQLPIENIDDASLVVLGLGPEVEVLEPVTLRRLVHDSAAALTARHAAPRVEAR